MMKLKLIVLLLFFSYAAHAQNTGLSHQYPVEELQKDFVFLRNKMETKNVNLYLYNSKKTIDSALDALYLGIDHPMTATQFYYHLTAIQPLIKDGHNYLLPGKELQDYYADNVLYFPLNLIEHEGRIYVTQNFSGDSTIQAGDEIKSINGENAGAIFNTLVAHQVRDGDDLLYPKYVSQTYFRSYYGFLFGFPDQYQLEIIKAGGKTIVATIPAMKLAAIKQARAAVAAPRYDRTNFDKGIFWETNKAGNYTLLSIKTWSNDLLKSEYHQSFKKTSDQFIESLRANETKSLVIDLRGNQGGDGPNGIYLLRYLLNKPFVYFSSVKAYTGKMKLKNAGSALTKTYYPMDYVFKGDVYVLTDGGSFSNSAIFAALIQSMQRGKIVGGETGGNGIVLSGGAGYFIAPYTKINLLKITNQMITLGNIKNPGSGVQPDIKIEPTFQNILDNDDVVLKQLIAIISRKD